MLKRILSAFLLCLCVSPVWGATPEGPANAGGGSYTGPNVSGTCSGTDNLKIGSNCYSCNIVSETHNSLEAGQFVTNVSISNDNKTLEVSQYKCVDVEYDSIDKWEKQAVSYCSTSIAQKLDIKNSRISMVNTKTNKLEVTYLYNSNGFYTDVDGNTRFVVGKTYKGDKFCVKVECFNDYTYNNGKCEPKNKCDGNDVNYEEDVDLAECQADWTERSWTGGEYATSCKKTCFDLENGSAEWRYVVVDCQAGYQRVNDDRKICEQKNVTDPETCESDCKDNSQCKICCGYMQNDPNIFWCPWNGCQCEGNNDELVDGKCVSNSSSSSPEASAQGTISASKQRCLDSRTTPEGKACCHWATTEATWDSTNQKCVCVNQNQEFKMNEDGETGSCVAKTAGSAQSSDVTDDEVHALLSTPSGDCANAEKRIIPIGENDSCGTDAGPVSVEACVKGMIAPDDVLPNVAAQQIGVTSRGFAGNEQGCFDQTNIPGNNKYKLSFVGYKPVYVCANQLKKDKVVCLESDSVLDEVDIIAMYDCLSDVLTKLNAVSGKNMFWDSIEDGYAKSYCDIVCADGHTRQEQETIVESQEHGQTFKTKQRYICVANGDVTTDNATTPMPGGGDNSGATAPAKPDGTPCTPTDKNAKSGKYQNGECIIVECKESYYKVSDDKKSCVEDKKAKSQAKIDELQKNADAMKEKEQSTANKLLGGATMAATGLGAMQAMSAYSEQQADEDAEEAMKAYLATFHCNYGGGKNVQGGEKDVQLPGGNELVDLYAEYVNLANNLKVRKAALDLRPGIEAEAILDSATSGLYDDVAIGKTSGAFTSLARALQDPNGADAAAWAEQKDKTAKNLKTGLTIAGVGAVAGAVGNLLINKNAPKENSKGILAKYKDGDMAEAVKKTDLADVAASVGIGKKEQNADAQAQQNVAVAQVPTTGEEDVVKTTNPENPSQEIEIVVPVVASSGSGTGSENEIVKRGGKIYKIKNITDADAALTALATQFGKTPSDRVKEAYDEYVQKCKNYNGVLSVEETSGSSDERYDVLCYFPDLDQTEQTVREAYNTTDGERYFSRNTTISEAIAIGEREPFKSTQYRRNYEEFGRRRDSMHATYSIRGMSVQIDDDTEISPQGKYSALIRVKDSEQIELQMVMPKGNDESQAYTVK